jgi:hypothetical protein
MGAAAALGMLDRETANGDQGSTAGVAAGLRRVWNGTERDSKEEQAVLDQVEQGASRLRDWQTSGFGDLELLFS